jgi:hypothetical protein
METVLDYARGGVFCARFVGSLLADHARERALSLLLRSLEALDPRIAAWVRR